MRTRSMVEKGFKKYGLNKKKRGNKNNTETYKT